MRRLLQVLLLLFAPALLYAQADQAAARQFLHNKLGVAEPQVTRILDIQTSTRLQVRESQLELNILKAELEKVLFPINVNMPEVRKLLDQSVQWKLKSDLAAISARVEIRKILGDVKYADYQRYLRSQNHPYRATRSWQSAPRNNGNGRVGGNASAF